MLKANIVILYCEIYNIYGSKIYENDNATSKREVVEINFCNLLLYPVSKGILSLGTRL